jgi:hypothetical protein
MTLPQILGRAPETATGLTAETIRAQLTERGVPTTPLNVITFVSPRGAFLTARLKVRAENSRTVHF